VTVFAVRSGWARIVDRRVRACDQCVVTVDVGADDPGAIVGPPQVRRTHSSGCADCFREPEQFGAVDHPRVRDALCITGVFEACRLDRQLHNIGHGRAKK
jgi:hypothetical protein